MQGQNRECALQGYVICAPTAEQIKSTCSMIVGAASLSLIARVSFSNRSYFQYNKSKCYVFKFGKSCWSAYCCFWKRRKDFSFRLLPFSFTGLHRCQCDQSNWQKIAWRLSAYRYPLFSYANLAKYYNKKITSGPSISSYQYYRQFRRDYSQKNLNKKKRRYIVPSKHRF